jgi:hypothetical protein
VVCGALRRMAPAEGRPPDAVPGMLRPDLTVKGVHAMLCHLHCLGIWGLPPPIGGAAALGGGSSEQATHKGASLSNARQRTVVLNALRL